MSVLLGILVGVACATAAAAWSTRSLDGSARLALVAVLGVMAAAFNVVVPIPSIEATTTVVLCAAAVLGIRTGIAVGLVAVVASSVAGGVGIWTLWQVLAVTAVGCLGAACGLLRQPHGPRAGERLVLLGLAAALAAVSWDVVVTVGGALSFTPAAGVGAADQVQALLLLGAPYTAVHALFCAGFTVVAGPALLAALDRARPRLDGGTVLAAAPS